MRKDVPTVKILVGYHKPAVLLKDDVLTPIHLGRAVATENSKDGKISEEDYKWMLDNMIGDDTGDNISHLNRKVCEMTGIYWAWKNYDKLGDPDYIGFMHYRRHFIFQDEQFTNKNCQFVYSNSYEVKDLVLKNSEIFNHAVIAPYKENVAKRNYQSVKDQFAKSKDHILSDLELAIEYIKNKYPRMASLADDYFNGETGYYYNMFVMKKKIFLDYAEFIFDILKHSLSSIKGQRRQAFVMERLTGFYLFYLSRKQKIYELPVAYIKNTDIVYPLDKVFNDNYIPVAFCSDNNYAPYTAVAIQSLIDNTPPEINLDIVILDELISEQYRNMIQRMQQENVSIRFYKMDKFGNDVFYVHGHFSKVTYYRFFLAEIFRQYEKVFYLDSDIIINGNISKLYNEVKFHSEILAAAVAVGPLYWYNKDNMVNSLKMKLRDYWNEILKINDPCKYFNAGVLLLNIEEFNKQNIYCKLFRAVKKIQNPPGVDQDILNSVCVNKVKIISNKYNFINHFCKNDLEQYLRNDIYNDQLQAYQNFIIMHYADIKKPWNYMDCFQADLWWKYARKSPFYEICLYKKLLNDLKENQKVQGGVIPTYKKVNIKKVIKKYFFYKIVKELALGRLKQKLKGKYVKYKKQLYGL